MTKIQMIKTIEKGIGRSGDQGGGDQRIGVSGKKRNPDVLISWYPLPDNLVS